MITVEEAASLAHVSSRTIYRWIEGGELHFIETPAGRVLICFDSLSFGVMASGNSGDR
jgi:excisionase family DNA binding protein